MQIDEVMQLVETMRELGTDITGVEAASRPAHSGGLATS